MIKRIPRTTAERGLQRDQFDLMMAEFACAYGAQVVPNPKNVGAFEYSIKLIVENGLATVGMRILLKEWQTDSDVTILTITTLPEEQRGKGHATRALGYLIEWAGEHGMNEIRATQVRIRSAIAFWEKNGFLRDSQGSTTGDFVRRFE